MTELEKLVNKPIEDFTNADIEVIANDEEMLKKLSNDQFTLKEIGEIMKRSKDQDVLDQCRPILIHAQLYIAEREIGAICNKNENNRENLLTEIKSYLDTHNNWWEVLPVYLLLLTSGNTEIEIEEERLLNMITALESDLYQLKIMLSIDIIFELLDMLYNLQELYFERTQKDIFEGNSSISNFVESVNSITQPLLEQAAREYSETLEDEKEEE